MTTMSGIPGVFSPEGFAAARIKLAREARSRGFTLYDRGLGTLFLGFRIDSPKVIMLIAGTHGVEGPVGYDLILDFVVSNDHRRLPRDLGVVIVLPLNAHGWATGRRTNRDNVDLNRNCWPACEELPTLPPLEPWVSELVKPTDCNRDWYGNLQAVLADPVRRAAFLGPVFRGQYNDPEGIFYGGEKIAVESLELGGFIGECLLDPGVCRRLLVFDIHSGLGEWGELTLISSAANNDKALRACLRAWFDGQVVYPNLRPDEAIKPVSADLLAWLGRDPFIEVIPLALEFGTQPLEASLAIFIAENYVHWRERRGERIDLSGFGPTMTPTEIRRQFVCHFYPPADEKLASNPIAEWSRVVRTAFQSILGRAVSGFSLRK